jgi:hypothetical protein
VGLNTFPDFSVSPVPLPGGWSPAGGAGVTGGGEGGTGGGTLLDVARGGLRYAKPADLVTALLGIEEALSGYEPNPKSRALKRGGDPKNPKH